MAIVQITIKTNEVEYQRAGFISLTLTNMMNSSEPLVAKGSVIEVGSSLYDFDANTDIDPDGDLAGISNGNMVWMYIDFANLKSIVTTTEPIWSTEKQGWYDATETYRYYACMFKDSSGNYINKQVLGDRFWSPEIFITGNYTVSDEFINMKIIQDSSVSSAGTVTLPTLADNIGKKVNIENRSTSYQLFIDGEGSETIETAFTVINLSTEYCVLEGTSSTWKRIKYSSVRPKYQIEDQKASGTIGGTFTSAAWQTRILNTELIAEIIGASLSSNQFTLPIGKYNIFASIPYFSTFRTYAKIYNITDASETNLVTGNNYGGANAGDNQVIIGELTITGTKTFELQHRCENTVVNNGFGVEAGSSFTVPYELYSKILIEKII